VEHLSLPSTAAAKVSSVVVSLALLSMIASRADAALTEGARLTAIYDAILAAQFESAEAQIRSACPPAPGEACDTLRLVAVWWRIALDPNSRAWDSRLEQAARVAIQGTERWVERDATRGEAWFYLAGAHAPRVQWQSLRGERLAAARDGKRIKDALERSLSLDPSLYDAHFGIGLYKYYADVAPAALKFLRWLLLLPGGNRTEGLRQMVETRTRGELLRGEADFQLHWLYLWYERQPERALELLRGLDARYPSNPVFLQRIAEVQTEYFHNREASAATWEELLSRATAGRVGERVLADTRARLGLADTLIATGKADRALHVLAPVLDARADNVYSSRALAHLLAGAAHDRLGARDHSGTEYRAAIATTPERDVYDVRDRARTALGRNF
jgi:tetratricopeptide (TPR) repeat protein